MQPVKSKNESKWSLAGDIFGDIQRVGLGLMVAGLIADFSISALIAIIQDHFIHSSSVLSLGKEVLGMPSLLREIMDVFFSTLPLTIAFVMIAARPRELLLPWPAGAAIVLILASVLGNLFHLGINPSGFKLDPNLPQSGIGVLWTLGVGFVGQYGLVLFLKSGVVGVVVGSRLRNLLKKNAGRP